MNKELLEIGDVLFEYGNYGVYNKVEVERITPKFAHLSDRARIRRKLTESCKWYNLDEAKSTSGLSWYLLPTAELEIKYFDKKAIEKIKAYPFSKLTHEQLVEIIKILP